MAKEKKSKWNGFSLKPRKEMPEGLWMKCSACEHMLYRSAVEKNLNVCPECDYHFRIDAATRIKYLADEDSFQQALSDLTTNDPLDFKFRGTTYRQRIKDDQKKSGVKEAMLIGKAFVKGRGIILAVMEPNFLWGSSGFVGGEKFCAAVDMAMLEKLPLVVVSCSGGARMHEGVVSLGQMAKTAAAVGKFDEAGGLFISVLTDPTTGGVSARFAMLGDCIIAEPGGLIGLD